MKRLLFSFCLLFTSLMFSQTKEDSLLTIIPTLKEDSTKVQAYLDLVEASYRNDLTLALQSAEKAEELAEKLGLKKELAIAKREQGYMLTDLRRYTQAEKKYNEALLIFRELGHSMGIANVKIDLGRTAMLQSKHEKAIKLLLEALTLTNQEGDKNREAIIYNHIGGLYKNQKQYNKAIKNYALALSLVRELDIKPGISACLTNLANTYNEMKEYEKAIEYNKESLKIKKETGDKLGEARVLNSLGAIHNNLEEFDAAENYLKLAHERATEVNDLNLVYEIEYGLARSYFGNHDYQRSTEMAENALKKLDSTATLEASSKIHRFLSQAYGEAGKFEKAYQSTVAAMKYSDSSYNEKVLTVTNDLEAKYQNEQKTQEITLLESDKELQALQLSKRINERNAIIAFAILALLLAALLYNQYRVKQKANKKLQELDRLKSNFFANISHEFRTPLTLIKGPIEQLEQNPGEQLSMDTVKMIRRNSTRVLKLVNQLLDLSQIDEGSLKLEPTEGDVYKCLRAATSSFNSHAAQRRIDYRVRIPQTAFWAAFDRDKLEKIAYNLLSNAFKFSEDGAMISFASSYGDIGLEIVVSDSGKGIPEEKLPFIFDRFYQVDGGVTRENEGSGIGLSLSKDLVDLMDGTITVSSIEGKGTTFKLHLPFEEIKSGREQREKVIHEQERDKSEPISVDLDTTDTRDVPTVLLVEDNTDMRYFIKEHLIKEYRVLEARDGVKGLEMAKAQAPDLIVTDLMMPKMDGIALCTELKTDVHTSHIPVIMLTAKAGQANKIQGLETGADDYLTKPFDSEELLVRTRNLIAQRKKLRELYSGKKKALDPKEIAVTSVDQRFLEKVLNLLEEHHQDGNFGVPRMQEALAMSKSQLHRKLKALTNEAPGELLRNFRLKRAAQLLSQKADTVTQIAYKVGFNDLSYFTKCFKEFYGVVPSAY